MKPPVKIDRVALFIAQYLSWARQRRVYATFAPFISYRGHACDTWELLPTLGRHRLPVDILKRQETEVIDQFRDRFGSSEWTDMEVLAFARHHGAPTRLLDWSTNPFVGLWFAISETKHDSTPGVVFQLATSGSNHVICAAEKFKLAFADNCGCKRPIHIFASPPRVQRTDRQRSVFTIASFNGDYILKPLEQIVQSETATPMRKFVVPSDLKPELRRLLSDLGLDAYSIYGDADSFGKSVALRMDISDMKISDAEKPAGKPDGPGAARNI
jgi:hypothetical protein